MDLGSERKKLKSGASIGAFDFLIKRHDNYSIMLAAVKAKIKILVAQHKNLKAEMSEIERIAKEVIANDHLDEY